MANTNQRAGVMIAVTADDDRYQPARRKAMDLARVSGQALILYDWDAPTLFELRPDARFQDGARSRLLGARAECRRMKAHRARSRPMFWRSNDA